MSVQSIERAFAVLRVLARGPLGVTEIADQTELPKSTVSRLLASLEAEGAVEQVEVGGVYSVGPTLATLGGSASPSPNLKSIVRPFIEELSLLTGGSAGLTIRRGVDAFWVDNVDDGGELVTLADQTGQTFRLHTIASGVAMLARFSSHELDDYVSTSVPADDAADLRHRIARVGFDGVFVSNADLDEGVNAIAAAFRVPHGGWDASVYLQGPAFRFPDDGDEQRVARLVCDTANQLTDRLAGV